MLEVCDLLFCFWFYRGLQIKDCLNLRRDFDLWTFNTLETIIDYGNFWSYTKCVFIMLWLGMTPKDTCVWTSLWGPGSGMWWFEYTWPMGYGSIRKVWPLWNRGALVGGSVPLCRLALRSLRLKHHPVGKRASSWLHSDQDTEFSAPLPRSACTMPCFLTWW